MFYAFAGTLSECYQNHELSSEKIVKAYWRDVTAEKWFQQFPTKILRYMLCLGVDAIDKPTGLGFSLIDSLFLEKIIGGWRPSHFIDDKLKPFLNSSEV